MGNDIPFVPNKKDGGFCFGNKIAPIFFNTMEDSGALSNESAMLARWKQEMSSRYTHTEARSKMKLEKLFRPSN